MTWRSCWACCAGQRSTNTKILSSKLQLRAPYVVPLNMLQASVMAKVRGLSHTAEQQRRSGSRSDLREGGALEWNPYANEETWELLHRDPPVDGSTKDLLLQAYTDTLIITIKGIAAGMQNTG